MDKQRYRPGQKVEHPAFGTGLVVDVKPGDRFDVLEVVFPSGTRRLSSLTPQLAPAEAGRRKEKPARPPEITAPSPQPAAEAGVSAPSPPHPAEPARVHYDEAAPGILERLRKRDFGPAGIFRLRLRAEELVREQGFQRLISLVELRDVEKFPHQEAACLRTLREMRGRVILADEVGLGKTIEAGIIMKEYLMRGLVRRVLILAPASLCLQWQEEMSRKFGLSFAIQATGSDWSEAPLLISSLERAKMPARRSAVMESRYDLVVVDEAHRLRNQRTLNRQLVAELAPRHLLLLTATPVQNDLRELYNLASLVRPGALGTWTGFKREFITRGDPRVPANPGKLRQLLRSVMLRSTRVSAGLQWSKRHVEVRFVRLSEPERELYDAVSDFAYRYLERSGGDHAEHLSLLVLEKEMGSSVQAAMRTLKALTRRARTETENQELARLSDMAAAVGTQAKLGALDDILGADPSQVVIFTQFLATLEYLQAELRKRGIPVEVFHGGLTENAKEKAIVRFRDRARVLISTEAGGEGRNLQFCHVLVNYDLPWNPMRVEQRIGRVHRLGQKHDVMVYNLAAEDTIEAYVLETLYRKIRLFELVVGEMENILSQLQEGSSFEDRIFRAWNGSNRREVRRRKFEQLADEILAAQRNYEQIRELDASILDEN